MSETNDEPEAVVQRIGRVNYRVSVRHGISEWSVPSGWHVWGRRRAERQALRRLAQYRRLVQWRSDTWTVAG